MADFPSEQAVPRGGDRRSKQALGELCDLGGNYRRANSSHKLHLTLFQLLLLYHQLPRNTHAENNHQLSCMSQILQVRNVGSLSWGFLCVSGGSDGWSGRGGSQASGHTNPADTLIFDFQPPEHISAVNPPSPRPHL